MTTIYFVRHAEPVQAWKDGRTRPLTAQGTKDRKKVTEALHNIKIDYAISSPYMRSVETIRDCAVDHGLDIVTEERFRERKGGPCCDRLGMHQKRWADFNFHEEGGESLAMVQERNMEALKELLLSHDSETILFGTHGTALSTILNYYDPSFGYKDFYRIINFMPYIIKLTFHGTACIGKEEILIVQEEYKEKL